MRIVIKIGTSNITYKTGNLNIRHFEKMCKVFSDIKNMGHEIILVSSGAIAMGVGKLALKTRPKDVRGKQAAASVGQCELMYIYDKYFGEYNHSVGQILLTADDVKDEKRVNNFKNTIEQLLEFNAIPIINENDTIATDEIGIGDNDTLSAIVAANISADLLVLLSDIDGLYTKNPKTHKDAQKIDLVEMIDDSIMALADGKDNELSTGGMLTKLNAAIIVTDVNCDMLIMNGDKLNDLYDVLEGKNVGTRFLGRK